MFSQIYRQFKARIGAKRPEAPFAVAQAADVSCWLINIPLMLSIFFLFLYLNEAVFLFTFMPAQQLRMVLFKQKFRCHCFVWVLFSFKTVEKVIIENQIHS